MKTFKKILSAFLVCCMLLSLCACHGKDEVALTIEGEEIRSALYLNALIDSDSEAKRRVDDEIAAAEKEETETEEETDYFSYTFSDGVGFVDYVKTKAIELCKEYVLYKKLVDAGTIKLEDDEKNNAEYYAQVYWYQQGFAYLYEPNGVSFDTYKEAFLYSYYSNAYFKHLYGEGGEKEVPKKDIKNDLLENYTLAHVLTITYEENATDDQKTAQKTKLEGYEKRIKAGETFENIYIEHSGEDAQDHKHEETENAPKIPHAIVLTDKDSETQNATPSADFETVYDMKVGETKIIESEDKTSITLYVKLDLASDEYYLTQFTDEILYNLKNEEFQKFVTEKTKDYKVEENTFATNRFDVEDIDYSVLENAYASANAAQ